MAIGPSIEPSEVGVSGLIWLFFSYGYALFYAANLIGEGSELLLLVPSMAGLVGSVVLPLLGAVPDAAIILFSGLGSIEIAQESLSVGIGALAGSTIMLLTIPWAFTVFVGRVNIENGKPTYWGSPKLTPGKTIEETLDHTGVYVSSEIRRGGFLMAITTIPYFLIQFPALFMHGSTGDIAKGEHWWSILALVVCVFGLVYYMRLQLEFSERGEADRRIAIAKKTLQAGKMSLSGVLKSTIKSIESSEHTTSNCADYGSVGLRQPSPESTRILKDLLKDAFSAYDDDNNGLLEKKEIRVFLKDFHETFDEDEIDKLLQKIDSNNDKVICLDEFVVLCYHLIIDESDHNGNHQVNHAFRKSVQNAITSVDSSEGEELEVEEIPEDFCDLSPEEQQTAIKFRAFKMLAAGTLMVIYFSDPMVDVMQEIAVKANIPSFYVSFVLAPLASNSSEVVASMFFGAKKTRKSMTVALSALEGAACMNNTFCLSVFMGLIYFRGLAWRYTAETASIVIVQFIMAYFVQKKVMTIRVALYVLLLFPSSLVFVAFLEHLGFD